MKDMKFYLCDGVTKEQITSIATAELPKIGDESPWICGQIHKIKELFFSQTHTLNENIKAYQVIIRDMDTDHKYIQYVHTYINA